MADDGTPKLPDPQRKMIAAKIDNPALDRLNAEHLNRRAIGESIDVALAVCGISRQEASWTMGYGNNAAPLSRWVSGTENAPLYKLMLLGDEWIFDGAVRQEDSRRRAHQDDGRTYAEGGVQ